MTMRIAIPKERIPGEKRVALVPETVSRLVKLGAEISIESGAGEGSYYMDLDYEKAGARIITDREAILKQAEVVFKVGPPFDEEIEFLKEGTILVCIMFPHRIPKRVIKLRDKKITVFAMDLIPRVTRAQSMDALSSQSTVAGYKAALLAANLCGRFFPMLTTAAGTIRPVKVFVMGAGIAGLQAIATSKRLGAVVEAYDVRRIVKEQVESLGARFLESPVEAEVGGGYARELTKEEKKREQERLSSHVGNADVVITTAQVPGRSAPRLITEEMVARMKPGSVILDLAAEGGGNCVLTKPGETFEKDGVLISGPVNLPSQLPIHASDMYAKNIYNFFTFLTQEGKTLEFDLQNDIISGSLLTHQGKICHAPTRELLEGGLL